jgi:hypothetical protein
MVAAPDADLHVRLAHFHDAYRKAEAAGAARVALSEQLEALPFCPKPVDPHSEPFERWKQYNDRWIRYMEQGGVDDLWDESERLHESMGEAINAVFDTPADTLPGAIKKLKIAYMVTGDSEGAGNGDEVLDVYQDLDDPWMPKVIRDLERLAQEG